jgi:hypothetical protein
MRAEILRDACGDLGLEATMRLLLSQWGRSRAGLHHASPRYFTPVDATRRNRRCYATHAAPCVGEERMRILFLHPGAKTQNIEQRHRPLTCTESARRQVWCVAHAGKSLAPSREQQV